MLTSKSCRQLASYSNPDLIGIDDPLNKLKGSLWNQNLHGWRGVNTTNVNVTNYVKELGNLAVVISLVNDAKVFSLFSNTNARIYQAFLGIDHVITNAATCRSPINDAAGTPMSAVSYLGSAYKAWMTKFVAGQNALITHTASMYSAAIPTSEPAYSHFIDSFNQKYGAASSLTFPVPQNWPNSALAMQKRAADCKPNQRRTAPPTFATRFFGDSEKQKTSTQAKATQLTTASLTLTTSSFGNSRNPTITPAASLPSSMTASTPAMATTTDQDDRICVNETTDETGPCDQVGGIMFRKKPSSTGPILTAIAAPKGQDPQICENPSAAEAGPCAQAAGKLNGTEPGTDTITPTLTGFSTQTTSPSVPPLIPNIQYGGPQGGVPHHRKTRTTLGLVAIFPVIRVVLCCSCVGCEWGLEAHRKSDW